MHYNHYKFSSFPEAQNHSKRNPPQKKTNDFNLTDSVTISSSSSIIERYRHVSVNMQLTAQVELKASFSARRGSIQFALVNCCHMAAGNMPSL